MTAVLEAKSPVVAPPSPHPVAVKCRAVTKSYTVGTNKVLALRGIDLDIHANELMMLVGPSGCGKTTLISVIAGILERDGGDCTIFGEDFKTMSSGQRARYRAFNIGFVFQAFNLLPALTAAENVSVPLLIQGKGRSKALAAAKEMLERVGMAAKVNSLPSQLSGGQQQRVAIARALVHAPRLIVCDEPTSALDHETGQKVIEVLKDLARTDGRALVIVTHDNRIYQYADRIAHMDDGQVDRIATSAVGF